MLALLSLSVALPAQAMPDAGSTFAWATSRDRLGTPYAQLEHRLGRTGQRSEIEANFSISGCKVFYWLDPDDRVTRISAEVTDVCHPAPEGRPVTPASTFGAEFRPSSHYGADCLGQCGLPEGGLLVLGRTGRINAEQSWSLFFRGADRNVSMSWLVGLPLGTVNPDGQAIGLRDPQPTLLPLLRQVRIRTIELNLFRPGAPRVTP